VQYPSTVLYFKTFYYVPINFLLFQTEEPQHFGDESSGELVLDLDELKDSTIEKIAQITYSSLEVSGDNTSTGPGAAGEWSKLSNQERTRKPRGKEQKYSSICCVLASKGHVRQIFQQKRYQNFYYFVIQYCTHYKNDTV
jgi:hypothetical protein